jgi:hypothetical protein
MPKKIPAVFALLVIASASAPRSADVSSLQATAAAVVDDTVLVEVDNPDPADESAAIQLTVQVDDGSLEQLTVPEVTYEASSSAVVAVSASQPIVQIIDDPQPISP